MNSSFFKANRHKITQSDESRLVVVGAYTQTQRGNDASFTFEQEANFWYLTGIEAPDWEVIVEGNKSWLVAPDVDQVHQVFDGSLSWDDAKRVSGVDDVLSRADADDLLRTLAKNMMQCIH